MLNKNIVLRVCRLCGVEKPHGTELFKGKDKESLLINIIDKYLPKEVSVGNIPFADNTKQNK